MNSARKDISGLVIDNGPAAAELALELSGESDGHIVELEHVTTLDEGLRRLAKGRFQLVMLNASVDGGSGLKTFLSVSERACGLPVVVWSNNDRENTELSILQVAAHESLGDGLINAESMSRSLRQVIDHVVANGTPQNGSSTDPLTGLPNKTGFLGQLKHVHREMWQSGGQFVVLFLNLDGFNSVNKSLGHDIGDQLLIEVAHRLRSTLRPQDTIARFGADEFTVLVRGVNTRRHVESIVQRLQRGLSEPFSVGSERLLFSASIGVAINSQNYRRADEMLRDANTAMHRAKSLGKARHQVFDVSMHRHAMQRLGVEGDLRRAIEEEELELYYQPFMSLEAEQIVGFEALVRWQRPGHGTVLPREFISVAEETGLIVPLGGWVLRDGCRQIKEWKTRFPDQNPYIGINVASQQISQSDLVGEVNRALREFDLDPSNLELEITESGIIENPVAAADVLKEIHRLGVRLSIDDFGTGYSSLSQLHRFQFDVLKIDCSFTNRLCKEDDNSLPFVCTILRLAKDQGMNVVAEGIETEQQLRKLQELDCDIGQGYYFSRPLPRKDATELLERSFAEPPASPKGASA